MKLQLPITITLPRKTKEDKVCHLNLNNYPHWHFQTYQQLKKSFKECVVTMMPSDRQELAPGPYRFTYTLYKGDGRAVDIPNVLTVIGKFTEDALVELGVISGDNHKVIQEVVYRWGGVDKTNPRAELEITSA
jgi:hypothetical protein